MALSTDGLVSLVTDSTEVFEFFNKDFQSR